MNYEMFVVVRLLRFYGGGQIWAHFLIKSVPRSGITVLCRVYFGIRRRGICAQVCHCPVAYSGAGAGMACWVGD